MDHFDCERYISIYTMFAEILERDWPRAPGSHRLFHGLKYVAKIKSLKNLWVTDTPITEAGVEEFKTALPKCRVVWSDSKQPRVTP